MDMAKDHAPAGSKLAQIAALKAGNYPTGGKLQKLAEQIDAAGKNAAFDGPTFLDRGRPDVRAAIEAAKAKATAKPAPQPVVNAKNPGNATPAPAPASPPVTPPPSGSKAPVTAKGSVKGKGAAKPAAKPAKGKAKTGKKTIATVRKAAIKTAKANAIKAGIPATAFKAAAADTVKRAKSLLSGSEQPRGAFTAEAIDEVIALLKRTKGVLSSEVQKAMKWNAKRVNRFMGDVPALCGIKLKSDREGADTRYTVKA